MKLYEWAQAVKERDGFKCVECGSAIKPHAHHVTPIILGGKNELSNGITLCQSCHKKKHVGKLSARSLASSPDRDKTILRHINIPLPDDLHLACKLWSIENDVSMTDAGLALITALVNGDTDMADIVQNRPLTS